MSRPIGAGIRAVCVALEKLGTSSSGPIGDMTGIDRSEVSRFAGRAESHGLLTIDRTAHPNTYTLVHGWRSRADSLTRTPAVAPPGPRPVNSVFQMGDRAGARP